MNRPVDWDTVFGIDDPTPGDPIQVRRVATSWGGLADDAEYAETKLRALLSDDAIVGWIGEGGDAFRDKTGDLPDQLGKCKRSYRIASTALDWWATKLTTHQSDADAALVKGRAALHDLHAAQADLTSADSSVTSASGSSVLALSKKYADSPPPASVHMPSSSDVRAAQNRLSAAKAAQSSASSAVSAAQSRLDAAKRLALDAGELRVGDGKTTAGKIHDASDAGIPERSWWDKLKDWVAEAWDIIIVVCKIVVAVLGIVALILGGPLAWIVLAAAILVLADTLMKYAKGQATLLDVALAALDCIPGAKGLTSVAKLSAAFKAGGLLKAGAHLLGAGKTALVDMAKGVRTLASGLRTTVVAFGKNAVLRLNHLTALGRGFRSMVGSEFGLRGAMQSLPDLLKVPMPTEGMTVYRVHGLQIDSGGNLMNIEGRPADWFHGSRPNGASWTPSDPLSAGDFRMEAGLPHENPGTFMTEGSLVDPSAVSEIRLGLPLDGNPGGFPEYIINDPATAVSPTTIGGLNEPWTQTPGSFTP